MLKKYVEILFIIVTFVSSKYQFPFLVLNIIGKYDDYSSKIDNYEQSYRQYKYSYVFWIHYVINYLIRYKHN
ncbi:MAG: hypothetical protein D8M57_01180 [Candidatus Scalindua sp. AMX11]|nr:MAG: hypothetical protein DWQ00_15160 [Candidatus Scalindua sp.]TDE66682.1 MAG: hypothetical protein D8M57_01180 [Candidatus Scalindua sp. AMX11]GJQ57987.1 MAG: hypothetical protein SCALA701_07880 [Candidatus Scalindua sp.]